MSISNDIELAKGLQPEDLAIVKLCERIQEAVIVADIKTQRIVLWNSAAVNVFGYSTSEALKLRIEALIPKHLKAFHRTAMARLAKMSHEPYAGSNKLLELPVLKKGDEEIHVELSLSLIGSTNGTNGSGQFVLAIIREVTERKRAEEQLQHQAYHDFLTNLPNRALFMDRLCHALTRKKRHEEVIAVLFLDLDNFKVVNDSFGHEAGDNLLVSVAERIQRYLRPEDTIARFGGDELTILLEDLTDTDGAARVAERITEAMRAPFTLDDRDILITTSIGIVLDTSSYDHPTNLLRDADVALYHAKAKGKARYEVFDADLEHSGSGIAQSVDKSVSSY